MTFVGTALSKVIGIIFGKLWKGCMVQMPHKVQLVTMSTFITSRSKSTTVACWSVSWWREIPQQLILAIPLVNCQALLCSYSMIAGLLFNFLRSIPFASLTSSKLKKHRRIFMNWAPRCQATPSFVPPIILFQVWNLILTLNTSFPQLSPLFMQCRHILLF